MRIAIQAKRYERNSVGNGAVQEVVAALKVYNCCEGWVITNAEFTPAAKALAASNGVRLLDGNDLLHIEERLHTLGAMAAETSGKTLIGS